MIRVNFTPFAFDAEPDPGNVVVLDATKSPPAVLARMTVQASVNCRSEEPKAKARTA